MNEFYNLILKFKYLVSLSHRIRQLTHHIQHIIQSDGFKRGRIDALRLGKIKQLEIPGLSANVLTNIFGFFSYKEQFEKLRPICRKFAEAFRKHLVLETFDIDKRLQNYN